MSTGSLVGRAAELDAIAAAFHRARDGEPFAVWVEGQAGSGKTSLVQAAVRRFLQVHPDSTVLHAAGDAQEQLIEYALADQLLHQARRFTTAPLREKSPRSVALELLDRLGRAVQSGPVLLDLDDLHWCDHSSRHVLRFLMRRLDGMPVVVLLTHRPMGQWPGEVRHASSQLDTSTIELGGLSVAEVRELASARGVPLTSRAARRLHAHTGGTPQLVRTLLEELSPDELTASEGPLPAPRSFVEWVGQTFAAAEPPVRAAVGAVAVLGSAVPLSRIAAMTGLDHPQAAVDEATRQRLLRLVLRGEQRLIDVDHALVRSAVEQAMSFGDYSRLHERAAVLTHDPLRAIVHRLHASSQVDVELADEAVALAESQAAAGAVLASARLLVLAGRTMPSGPRRQEVWVTAAERLLMVGELPWAENLLGDVAADRQGEPPAYELLVRGHLALQRGRPEEARQAATRTWEQGRDPRVVVGAAELMAYLSMDVGDGDGATTWGARAIEAVDTRLARLQWASTVLVSGWALRGDLSHARDFLQQHQQRLTGTASEPDIRLGLALTALWTGELGDASEQFRALEARLEHGSTVLRSTARLARAELDYRQGRWDEVLATTESELGLIDEGWESRTAPMTLAVGAYVGAGRGEVARAQAFIDRAEGLLDAGANVPSRTMLAVARARLAWAGEDAAAVVDALSPLLEDPANWIPEGVHAWRADLAEACVALGRIDEAESVLQASADEGGPHALAGILRARGVVAAARGDVAAGEQHLAQAVALGVGASGPYMNARARLALGALLRRLGQRRNAAEQLRAAITIGEQLAAGPLLTRARSELDLCGLRRVDRSDALTPAEEAVARLAVGGMTNREIALSLTVSIKTVETHMSRIFTKLGVRHRVELVNALGEH